MSVPMIVAIAFAAGCASVGMTWAIAAAVSAARASARESVRARTAKAIGSLCAEVDNLLSSHKAGIVDAASFKGTVAAKLESIQKLLRENMHQLDQFYARYVERYVHDGWQALITTTTVPQAGPAPVPAQTFVARETTQIPAVVGRVHEEGLAVPPPPLPVLQPLQQQPLDDSLSSPSSDGGDQPQDLAVSSPWRPAEDDGTQTDAASVPLGQDESAFDVAEPVDFEQVQFDEQSGGDELGEQNADSADAAYPSDAAWTPQREEDAVPTLDELETFEPSDEDRLKTDDASESDDPFASVEERMSHSTASSDQQDPFVVAPSSSQSDEPAAVASDDEPGFSATGYEEQDGEEEPFFSMAPQDEGDGIPLAEETMILDLPDSTDEGDDSQQSCKESATAGLSMDSEFVAGATQVFNRESLRQFQQEMRREAEDNEVEEVGLDTSSPQLSSEAADVERDAQILIPRPPVGIPIPPVIPLSEPEVEDAAPASKKEKSDTDGSLITGDDIMEQMDSFFGI